MSNRRSSFAAPLMLTALPLLSLLMACTPKSKDVTMDIQSSLTANAQAASESDWHSSPATPEKIFANWNAKLIQKQITSSDVCTALSQINDKDLALFEEELRAPRNVALLNGCQDQVIARLDVYWKTQRRTLQVNTVNLGTDQNSFQFADDVQYRDMSNGYFAVSGDVAPKEVILTFDDGPSGQYTPMILQALAKVNAKAIFFEMGSNVKRFPEMTKMVAAGGHSIGGHSITHRCLANKTICAHNNGRMLSYDEAITEIAGSLQDVYNVIGWVDPFFRFPYGESDPDLKKYLQDNGIGEFYWEIDSEDWKSKTPQAVIDDTMRQVRQRNRGIILFHDIHHRTAEALPEFLATLHNEGYQPVLLKPARDQDRFNNKAVLTPTPLASLPPR
jgi:peptidoglycan/xylan/chitin deacetylase (PgdA/CDA1 family)